MIRFNYAELERLIETEDYQGAVAFCRAALGAGQSEQFWETQLGYVNFLNEGNVESYYNQAPAIFKSLVAKDPANVNAHFWLGYIYNIVLHDVENAKWELREALSLEPNHPYVNLVLAGLVDLETSSELLQRVLNVQPMNFRARRQLAQVLLATGQKIEVQRTLAMTLTHCPYVERNYGVMNRYINDVLTGATHERAWKTDAQVWLTELA